MRGLATRFSVAAVATAALVLLTAVPAFAHGERTQPSWVRSTTSTFFDLEYSGDVRTLGTGGAREYALDVGDVLRLKGKVHISDKWPAVLGGFELGQIGVLMRGPVLALRDLRVNGVFTPGSVVMKPGDSFEFEAELVGRRAGRYHIHPRIDLKGKGPVVGPGTWVRVRDSGAYARDVTLASGERVNLETYAVGRVYGYHFLWIGIAAVFCTAWLWRKRLLSRLVAVRNGVPDDELVSSRDRWLTTAIGGLSLLLIVGGFVYAANEWSTIPIQVRRETVPELRPPALADATMRSARYDDHGRSLEMVVEVTNRSNTPVEIERLVVGTVSAASPSFAVVGHDEPMELEPRGAVEPGQTRTVTMRVPTTALEEDRLLFTNSAVAQVGGLLVMRDAAGQRSWRSLVADLVPAGADVTT